MFVICLGISILVSSLAPVGQWLFIAMAPHNIRSILSPFWIQALLILFKYFLPALVAYGLLRSIGIQKKYNFRARGFSLVLIGSALIVFFRLALAFASGVEGGGAAYVVAQLGVFVFIPAWIAILIGLIQIWRSQPSS